MSMIKPRPVTAADFLCAALTLLLLGCGGGGESPSSGSEQPPVATARPLTAQTLKLLTAVPVKGESMMMAVEGTGDVLRYEWDLGDGNKRSTDVPSIQHSYQDEGEYNVALSVLGKAGDTATVNLKVSVRHAQPQIFIEALGRAEIPWLSDGIQYFASRLVYDYDRKPQQAAPDGNSYLWDFGDGQQAKTAAASHVYAKTGDYTVTLTLTDRYGRSSSAKQSVKVSTASAWPLRTSIGGPGYEDRGSLSLFDNPDNLVRAPDGTLFVYDRGNRVVRRITKDGAVITLAGAKSVSRGKDGKGDEARFEGISAMALGADGTLYLVSSGLRSLSPDGKVALVIPESDTPKDGAVATASLNYPRSVAVRKDGAIYVDSGSSIRLLKSGQLTHVAGQVAEHGAADGPADQARFGQIKALALDPQERLLILDGCGGLRRLDADGKVTTLMSWKTLDPAAKECARNDYSRAPIAAAADGTIYLAAWGIKDLYGTTTIVRLGPDGRLQETLRTTATLREVTSLAVDGKELLFTISGGHTIQRRRSNGTIVAEAGRSVEDEGNTLPTYPPAPKLLGEGLYQSMALTKQGDAVFNDSGRLMMFFARDRSMEVLLAPPESITQIPIIDGPRGIAQASFIGRVATGGVDQIYFNDRSALRRYDPDGRVSTLAGAAHQRADADGPGHLARFGDIRDIAADAAGKVYVLSTTGDNKTRVAVVDPTGTVKTLLRSEVRFTRLLLTATGRLVLQADYDRTLQILMADGSLAPLGKPEGDFVSWAAHPDGSVWVLLGARNLDLGFSRELVRIEPDGSMKSALQLSTVQKTTHYALAPMELNIPVSAMAFHQNGTLLLMGEGEMGRRQALPGSFWRLEDLPSGR